MYTESKMGGRSQYIQTVALTRESSFASQYIKCGKCEKHCPQGLSIREKLVDADRDLRPIPFKMAIAVGRKFMMRKARKKNS